MANSLNGQNIGRITKATIPLRLHISGNHQEEISLLIRDNPPLASHPGALLEEWPKLGDCQALQRFLGFANFYRRFIRNYSSIAAPLTHLTSTKVRFVWDQEAEEAFAKLKRRFTSAPILVHPDLERQFIVEVIASNEGVGAILSKCSAGDSKVHPCAFYSHRLSPGEQNYDMSWAIPPNSPTTRVPTEPHHSFSASSGGWR